MSDQIHGKQLLNSSVDLTTKVTGVLPIANGGNRVLANTTPFLSVSTNTDEIAMSFAIPAGTLVAGDIIDWIFLCSQVNSGAALKTWKFWINNANNLTGATQIGQNQTTSSFGVVQDARTFAVVSNTSILALFGGTTATGTTYGNTANATSSSTITIPTLASNTWIIATVRRANGGDVAKIEYGMLRFNKQ